MSDLIQVDVTSDIAVITLTNPPVNALGQAVCRAVLDAVQNSKFKKYPGFGTKKTGHILLTDHKDHCEFKNIRIREFK